MDAISVSSAFLDLPSEILLGIAKHLTGKDLISFAQSCSRFSAICRCLRSLPLQELWRNSVSCPALKTFLTQNIEGTILTECNFNNCFWIPSVLLKSFIKKCKNIQTLGIAETQLDLEDLPIIFSKCKKVTELSLSLHKHDNVVRSIPTFNSGIISVRSWYPFLENCADSLNKLNKLEIIAHQGTLKRMAVLVSFCDALKELILYFVSQPKSSLAPESNYINVGGKFSLNSFILVGSNEPPCSEYTFRESTLDYLGFKADVSRFIVFWSDMSPCPSTDCKKFAALSFRDVPQEDLPMLYNNEIEDIQPWVLEDPFKHIDLKSTTSVKENCPTFMLNRLCAPQVKLMSCYYSPKEFADFCFNHQSLKVLKLNLFIDLYHYNKDNPVVGDEWFAGSWKYLTQLEALSLEASLLKTVEKPKSGKRKRKEAFPEATSYVRTFTSRRSPILEVIQGCLMLEELEIIHFSSDPTPRIDGEDLCHIAQCKLLRKLTLGDFLITDGVFLEEIISNCTKLESLRLSSLGSPLLCCFVRNLCASLHKAKNLTLLSIHQRNMVPMAKLFDAVEQCPSLVRFGFVSPSDSIPFKWTAHELARRLLTMCDKLPNLVALFGAMNIPKIHCAKVMKHLKQQMVPKRPSFCVDIQALDEKSSLEIEATPLPFIHNILVNFGSRVAMHPYGFKSSVL